MLTLTWYLVMIATGQYIGPISQEACLGAAKLTVSQGIICRQAQAMKLCPVPDHPELFTSCPVFDYPQLTKGDKFH